jgi:hypothetical protein
MVQRSDTQTASMNGDIGAIVEAHGPMQKASNWFARHTYFMQTAVQNVLDAVVWLGAFEGAKAKGQTEEEAARLADTAVRTTQGSANPEDTARVETGDGWQRLFVMLYSYFNMWGNVMSTEFRLAAKEAGLKKKAGRMVYVYFAAFAIPALIAQAIADGMRGDLPDEEDEPLAAWLEWFFLSQGKTAAAMAPGGAIAVAGFNIWNDKPYDDRIASSPAISALESAVRTPLSIYDLATGEGDLSRTVKDTLGLVTLLTGIPVQALARPLGYAADVLEGDTEPTDALDAARGAMAGR